MPDERERSGSSRERGRGSERRGERNREEEQEALARRIRHFLRGGASSASGESEALRAQLHEAAEFLASRTDDEDAGFIQVLHAATAAEFRDLNLPDAVVARIARWGQAMGLVLAGHAQRGSGGEDAPPLPPDVYHIVNPRVIEAHLDESGRDLHIRFEDGRVGILVILIDGGTRRDEVMDAIGQAAREARALTRPPFPAPPSMPPLLETVIEADEVEAFADPEMDDSGVTFLLDEGELAPVLICHLTAVQMEALWQVVRDAQPEEHGSH
ncbi:MAG: hypothetical protein IT341_07395 [Chloroflexi bacterium]|nr:hypothetical protein [Chloroflexota bacterium]